MDNTKHVETLIRQLDKQREAYMDTFQKVHELLAKNLAATVQRDSIRSLTPQSIPQDVLPQSPNPQSILKTTFDREAGVHGTPTGLSFPTSSHSRSTGNESDNDDDDEALYVQTPLESQSHNIEDMRTHLRAYKWDQYLKKMLDGVVGNPARLSETPLLPNRKGKLEDRSDITHCQVFDVGPDGAPLPVDFSHVERDSGRAMAIWHTIKDINPPSKQRHAVGRITILREPSPILFGAIHYTMNEAFDVDELFRNLHETEMSSASIHRVFDSDERRRRSFVFNFEYFTLLGKDCEPMRWQLAAGQEDRKPGHIAITRCSSAVALVLNGPKIKDIKNPSRRVRGEKGQVYDPFSSWQVLNIQCYPDFKASLDVHESSKHYVNGPEAFLSTLLGEFKDAQRRLGDITRRISRRVRPGPEFMFDAEIRDRLLFEDSTYSMARRYFWSHQTLGILNESVKAMIDSFEEIFTNDVWEGKHKTLWPLLDEHRSRNKHYRKKMQELKSEFEKVIRNLRRLMDENDDRRKEIHGLREDLFTGTSIEESRKSVMATETTVQQGHNIKLLTLVSIFFLPLTFVTSIFGMTDMPTDKDGYREFAIVTSVVCIPFFVLIGSLNTNRGMNFWRKRTRAVFSSVGSFFTWLVKKKESSEPGLLTVKTFDSTTTSTGSYRLRKYPSNQNHNTWKATRGTEIEEPNSREEETERKLVEDGPPSVLLSPGTMRPLQPTSTIAEMWMGEKERRRRLRYSEDV